MTEKLSSKGMYVDHRVAIAEVNYQMYAETNDSHLKKEG
jgi:hypothetical protein